MSEPRWQSNGSHPPPGMLTLHLEGELDARESAGISRHLQDCWECRTHSERLQRGVYAYMTYRNEVLLPSIPPALRSKHRFYRKLDELATQPMHESLLRRVLRLCAQQSFEHAGAGWIAATISAVAIALLLLFPMAHPPALTAAELLHRAIVSEKAARPGPRQIIYKKVRIRRGSRSLEREIYSRALRPAAATPLPDPDLNRAFAEAKIDWNEPLSSEGFAVWRDGLNREQDVVTESADAITLRTSPIDETPIRYAFLTLRRSDWRAVSERFEFRDEPALEITELAYEFRSVPTSDRSVDSVARRDPAETIPTPPAAFTDSQLEDAETLLREALHRIHADVQEMPEIRRDDGAIQLRAYAENAARREEILQAARSIPFVDAVVGDPEHLLDSAPTLNLRAEAAKPTTVYSTDPPLAKALWGHFGSMNLANQYMADLRDAYLRILVETSALRELGNRYSPDVFERLSPESRQRIMSIASDHLGVIRPRSGEYLKLLSPVLDDMIQAQKLAPDPPSSAQAAATCTPWLSFAPQFGDNVKNLQTSFRRLFVVDQTDAPVALNIEDLLRQSAASRSALLSQLETVCSIH